MYRLSHLNLLATALLSVAASITTCRAESAPQPLLNQLKGLVFIANADQVEASLTTSDIDVSAVPELNDPEFVASVKLFLHHSVTAQDLGALRQKTSEWLRQHQQPFTNVSIPEQNITSGIVHVLVTQYRLGHVHVQGAKYFSDTYISRTSGLQPGSRLSLDDLNSDLERLNRNPFLNVDAVFQPGEQNGETDITLRARDRLPLRFSSGFDTLGVRSLGIQEWNYGISWGNVFGSGQIVSYQYTRTVGGRSETHSISDSIPLPFGDQVLIFGSYGRQSPLLAAIFHDVGHSGQASIRYVHPFAHGRHVTQDLEVGYDFKTTDNNLAFAGFEVFAAQAQLNQFPVTYNGALIDKLGQTTFQNTFVYSPGKLTSDNNSEAIASLVPGAAAHYVYNRLVATRTTMLPAGWSAITRITSQNASRNLPFSEEIGGGGVGSVRGYYTDTALGSKGQLFSQELRLPPFSLIRHVESKYDGHDKGQVGVFYDYANLRQLGVDGGSDTHVGLASTGALFRYSISRFVDVQYDIGVRLRTAETIPHRGVYGQISITGNY